MKFAAEHDVVILGAGPAGTSAAIRLAQMGLDAGIVERRRFPRGHVGICISDETVALIDYLGLGREFNNAQFWRRNLSAVRWGDSETRLVPQQGYHVDRAVLDGLLLCRSRAAGVRVYQPVQVQKVERLQDSSWGVAIASDDRRQFLKARFIVDAAGRRPAIPGARIKDGPPLLSIHANWALRGMVEFDGLIEAGEDAWLWYARTARDRAVVSAFCDPRRVAASERGGVQAKYAGLLRQFRALSLEQMGEQCSDPQACDATSQHAEDPVGNSYIRLGDSCLSVDPLSSQGVHLALQSGLQGAIIVNTMLRKPENAEPARQFFRMRITERVGRYTGRTKQEYARVSAMCPNAFWHERAGGAPVVEAAGPYPPLEPAPRGPADQVAVSPHATLDAAPVIDGIFVQVRQVVRHPNIDGGVAYVEGVDLVRLLSALPPSFAYCDIPWIWRNHIPLATGSRIASWLWDKSILVQATG
ncbi:MAG: FAD-dependent oxidoreductase [Bradyrhizobium sp.]|uniref:flavin-dependent monooxygenase QhpG n=1 Tax=Bradyrhizobium sp. TaxID=376 RepID=UPI002721E89E|nr:FAD-dependent oxidoreductase [Bradyrhizobium sp.]MDO8396352.1 FAD-dependent oxidoreductase [Bradyrhizobium sp.]